MQTNGESIDARVLDRPVTGLGLRPGTLRDQIGDTESLLVFLRHLG